MDKQKTSLNIKTKTTKRQFLADPFLSATGTSGSLELEAECKIILNICPRTQKQTHLFNTWGGMRNVPAE
jgi:hypothetical protein